MMIEQKFSMRVIKRRVVVIKIPKKMKIRVRVLASVAAKDSQQHVEQEGKESVRFAKLQRMMDKGMAFQECNRISVMTSDGCKENKRSNENSPEV